MPFLNEHGNPENPDAFLWFLILLAIAVAIILTIQIGG
jgi:hypothetical protein